MALTDDVTAFFIDKAYAYTHGQLRYLSLLFDVPSEMRIGTQVLVADQHSVIEGLFRTYRSNLMKMGYTETRATVMHVAECARGQFQALIKYTNKGAEGAVLSTELANYTMRQGEQGLRITMSEFVDEPRPDLFVGFEDEFVQQTPH